MTLRMRSLLIMLFAACPGVSATVEAGALVARRLTGARLVEDALIVGRARCEDSTWLLTDRPSLTLVSATFLTATTAVRGFRPEDRPWGLACLPGGELWTLAGPGTLARLSLDGRVVERLAIERPALGLYATDRQVLLERAPTSAGQPLLAAGAPRSLSRSRPWPGLLAERPAPRGSPLTANLLNCGIGTAQYVPCWFVSRPRVVVGDGSASRTTSVDLPFIRAADADESAPIWDVALAGASRMWVLSTSRVPLKGRRIGGRLTESDRHARDDGHIDLRPEARAIVSATERTCVLLLSNGELVEVAQR